MRTLTLALAFLTFAGCSGVEPPPKTTKVDGIVNHKGAPLSKGKVTLHPEGAGGSGPSRPAVGQVENGKFTLSTFASGDGAMPGAYKVTVESVEEVSMEDFNAGKRDKLLIPKKYSSTHSSGLTATVPDQAEPFVLTLDLKD